MQDVLEELIKIDFEKCTKCGLCVKSCGAYVFEMGSNGPEIKFPEKCSECGHCIAICPVDAITHINMNSADFLPVKSPGISYEQMLDLIRNRKSIRRYKQNPLSEEHIQKIMDAVRYIPTAENTQSLKYIVINNTKRMKLIRDKMYQKFKIAGWLKFILPKVTKLQVEQTLKKYIEGKENLSEDPFLRTAPAMIVIYSKKKNTLKLWDAGIASHNIILVCETLGISTVWNGVHAIMANIFGSIRKASLVPRGYKILGTICLGYPKIKYIKTVYRKPLDIKIDETDHE